MCKERIEDAAHGLDGVQSATWDSESKMIHLDFDPDKVTTADIEQAIAAVGHDTENIKASDDVYEELHECCKYERPEYK
jgi:copper chaperone CopZ